MLKKLFKTSVIIVSFCASASFAGSINVIVNKSVRVDALDEEQIKAIYMARRKEFSSGQSVVPLDNNEESKLYVNFYKLVLHKNVSDINAYWSRKLFTGAGTPPRQITSKEELIDMVAGNPQFIAYVEGDITSDKVKVVYTINAQ